jgi:hypothetical protein
VIADSGFSTTEQKHNGKRWEMQVLFAVLIGEF